MGNQQSAVARDRHKSGSQDLIPGSPIRGMQMQILPILLETQFYFSFFNCP